MESEMERQIHMTEEREAFQKECAQLEKKNIKTERNAFKKELQAKQRRRKAFPEAKYHLWREREKMTMLMESIKYDRETLKIVKEEMAMMGKA